jgi:signal transduction histidine kinase
VAYLPDLVDRIRAAGTTASLVITGDPVPLPASVDLSAYRIVQEALTNTIKHAGRGGAVECAWTSGGAAGAGGRRRRRRRPGRRGRDGLRGIAERVSMLGGEWSAGPAPERVSGSGPRCRWRPT